MNSRDTIRIPARARTTPRPATRRRFAMRPGLEGLEDRLVLSHAAPSATHIHAAAQVSRAATTAPQTLSVPIVVEGINVTGITRDATSGVLSLAGTVTGTILGQSFSSPLTGTITPGRTASVAPKLALGLQPINLSLVGLNIQTSAIDFNLSTGPGTLGKLLGGGLKNVVTSAAGTGTGSTAAALSQLNGLVGNSQILGALNTILGKAKPLVDTFTPTQGTAAPAVGLSLGSFRLGQKGLGDLLNNGQGGALTVNLSGNASGGLLGTLLSGITGSPTGKVLSQDVAGVLTQITATPIPTVASLGGGGTTGTGSGTGTSGGTGTGTTAGGSTLITIDLKPLDVNLLGLEVKTSEITVTVTAQPGSGNLLGNLLSTVSNLINLQGVNNALNTVLGNVVTLANESSLSVTGVNTGGTFGTTTSTAPIPVLTAHVAPVHLDLLGAVVDTSPIDLSITAHPGAGLVLGNVIAALAGLLDTPPAGGKLDIPYLTTQIHTLNDELAAEIPGIAAAPSPSHTVPAGTTNVLSLNVAPINLNLLGLVLQTDQIQVNADAQSGGGDLLGNLLTDLLNTLDGTPTNLTALNGEVNNLLAKVVGVLNATNLVLPTNAPELPEPDPANPGTSQPGEHHRDTGHRAGAEPGHRLDRRRRPAHRREPAGPGRHDERRPRATRRADGHQQHPRQPRLQRLPPARSRRLDRPAHDPQHPGPLSRD